MIGSLAVNVRDKAIEGIKACRGTNEWPSWGVPLTRWKHLRWFARLTIQLATLMLLICWRESDEIRRVILMNEPWLKAFMFPASGRMTLTVKGVRTAEVAFR